MIYYYIEWYLTFLINIVLWSHLEAGNQLRKEWVDPNWGVANVEDMLFVLGCEGGELPSAYLSPPLSAFFKSLSVWDGVEGKFWRSLS